MSRDVARPGTFLQAAAAAEGAAIVLARVQRVHLTSVGSRSEAAVLALRVDQVLCGASPSSLTAWCYTAGKNSLIGLGRMPQEGETYVLAFERANPAAPAPYALVELARVPEGGEDEMVEAHLEALGAVD